MMKPKNLFVAVCVLCALCVVGCENKKVDTPQVSSIVVSECKGMELNVDSLPESIEFVLQSGVLHVKHNNVFANCGAPLYLQVHCMVVGDSITIMENPGDRANCYGIYDWTYCISPFNAGIWHIRLNNDTTFFIVTIDETTRSLNL